MGELFVIVISSMLVSNVVLSQFLGICPFLGVSKKVETASSNFFDKTVNSFRNLYVCIQVFPENPCNMKGAVHLGNLQSYKKGRNF